MIPVRSRVHRILERMPRFRIDERTSAELGHVVGVYELENGIETSIVVGELGISILNMHSVVHVLYRDLETIVLPNDKSGRQLVVFDKSDRKFIISFPDDGSKFSDIFEFLRFLNRVRADAAISNEA